jgi:hypothetical protein
MSSTIELLYRGVACCGNRFSGDINVSKHALQRAAECRQTDGPRPAESLCWAPHAWASRAGTARESGARGRAVPDRRATRHFAAP